MNQKPFMKGVLGIIVLLTKSGSATIKHVVDGQHAMSDRLTIVDMNIPPTAFPKNSPDFCM